MRYFILLLAMILCLPITAMSQTDTYEIDEVVVIGTDGFTSAERATATHNVVFDEEMIQNSTAENLSDFLLQMGFAVIPAATAYGTTDVYIRGYDNGHHWNESSSRIVFLINGRRSGINNIRQLALNNVERIEIIRGPEMYLYTAGSPGGVVNIVTKRGGDKLFSGSMELGLGSYNQKKAQMALNGSYEGFDWSGAYMYESVKDYNDSKGDRVGFSRIDGINAFNGTVGYSFLGGNHRIGAELYYYDVDKAGQPAYWDETEMMMRAASFADRKSYLMALVYDGSTSDKQWLWNASYQFSHDRYESYDPKLKGQQYFMGNKIETQQARGSLKYTSDLFDVTGGADFMQYKTWNSGSPNANGRAQYGPNFIGTPLHLGHTSNTYGLSLIGTLKLLDNKINITGGLRYDYTKVKDNCVGDEPWWWGRKNALYGNNRYGNMPTNRTFKHLSPAIGITYTPLDWLKLRANYTQGYRPPGGRQLFSSDATEGYGAPGYPLLKAEYSDNYEIGFDMAFTDVNFSFTYFYSKFKNHITIRTYQPSNVGVGVTAMNADERRQAGLEISGSANVAGLLGFKSFEVRPYFSLTYMTQMEELVTRGRDYSHLGSRFGSWTDITGIPELTASWGVSFRNQGWGTSANLNFYYFGEAKVSGSSGPNSGLPSMGTYGKFTLANLAISQKLFEYEDYGDLTLKVHVNNIFNETYNYNSSGMAKSSPWYPGRNFYVGLAVNF